MPDAALVCGDGYVRMLDDFKMGPNLVRGFQPAGIGPRDITSGTSNDALGGTMYWGASLELQYPFYFLPKDAGIRGAVFIDSGSEWGYQGETAWPANGEVNGTITTSTGVSYSLRQLRDAIRRFRGPARVRRRQYYLGFAVRSAAVRFRLSDPEAAVRPRPVVPVRRRSAVLIGPAAVVEAGRMPDFFPTRRELTIGEIAALTGAEPRAGAPLDRRIGNIAPLDAARASDITFPRQSKYLDELATTRAGACLLPPRFEAAAPDHLPVLVTAEPYRAFVAVARALFPAALRPSSLFGASGRAASAHVHPSARLEAGVTSIRSR